VTAEEIARLAIIVAPLVQELVIDGVKIAMTFKQKMTDEDMTKALELSKSANWPKLAFAPDIAAPAPETREL
jgi:hypothetical protein